MTWAVFDGPYSTRAVIHGIQDECRFGKGWDEPLSEENRQRWLRWLDDLPLLEDFHIKRCLLPEDVEISRIEVHVFSDASQEAYGAVAYLRSVSSEGQIHCAFVIGKSRLAPMRVVTIPRLELMAAVLYIYNIYIGCTD